MRTVFLAVLSGVIFASPEPLLAQGHFTELIIFGDTLSDMGNASAATRGLQPGPFYFSGRFSNGPVYGELLAEHLGLESLTPSSDGGGNYAFGGAQTSGSGGLPGLFIEDIDEQVDDFLGSGPLSGRPLIVVFAGANDFLNGGTDVNLPVTNLIDDLQRLLDSGASDLLVMNLPPLGAAPRFNAEPLQAAAMNMLSEQFNDGLWAALDDVAETHPDVDLYRLDVAELFGEILTAPAAFGFSNIVDPAAPGLVPGATSYDTDLIVGEPDQYLFWDELHPTAAAHAILAERALAAVPEPSGSVLAIS